MITLGMTIWSQCLKRSTVFLLIISGLQFADQDDRNKPPAHSPSLVNRFLFLADKKVSTSMPRCDPLLTSCVLKSFQTFLWD